MKENLFAVVGGILKILILDLFRNPKYLNIQDKISMIFKILFIVNKLIAMQISKSMGLTGQLVPEYISSENFNWIHPYVRNLPRIFLVIIFQLLCKVGGKCMLYTLKRFHHF